MMQGCFRLSLLAALALPVFAQDPPAPTAASGPILVLKTAKAELATMVAMKFEPAVEMPELPADGHFVVSLGADRKVVVATGAGNVGLLDLVGDPGALLDVFAEDIEAVKPMLQGTLTMAMQPQGMTAKDVAVLVKGILDFPKQLRQIELKVVGDPEVAPQDGIDIKLALEPKAGAGFATFVEALQPCAQGAPELGPADAMVKMRFSLAPDSLAKVFAPFREWAINLTNQGAEQRQKANAIYDRWMQIYDGGLSASFGGGDQLSGHILIGSLDADKLQQLMASEEYLAMLKGQQMGDAEIEITPNAFEHRDVKVMKSVMTGYDPNPLMPDGSMESFGGAAGSYLFVTFGGKEAAAKAAIDAIADQKVKRSPLPAGTLIDMAIDMKAMAAIMQGEADEDMPGKLLLSFGKRGKALALHVSMK